MSYVVRYVVENKNKTHSRVTDFSVENLTRR